MKVIVYVEGVSDQRGLEVLLEPLIEKKREEGTAIELFPSPAGDKKASLLTKVPIRAANILLNDRDAVVAAMPDLYPKNKSFAHTTPEELAEGLVTRFCAAVESKGGTIDAILHRFKVFCFKYDFEALLLAAEESLVAVADLKKVLWKRPVEEQDHDRPPKRIVEELFAARGERYVGTFHAPLILRAARYTKIAERCPQCFGPFVDFLERL